MIAVTHNKVAGFEPRWASFRGFSLLFDNPGASVSPMGNALKADCSVDMDANLQLYKAFTDALDKIGLDLLINTYLFCPLPPYSYHVTAWDGVNDRNIGNVVSTQRPNFERFLKDLPESILSDTAFTGIINNSPLVTTTDRAITLKFGKLTKWGNSVLVARVMPADRESEDLIECMTRTRKCLSDRFRNLFGIRMFTGYTPHVSLGYFANKEYAELATSRVDDWTELVAERADGLTITYRSISLYGFTDMATFFKRSENA